MTIFPDMKKLYIACIAFAAMMALTSCDKKTETEYTTTKIERGDVVNSVTATGTIEPVVSVEVGTQVSGIVRRIYVDYNSHVEAGQVIAELDRANLISELNSARAQLASAKAQLEGLMRNADGARAQLASAKATVKAAQANLASLQSKLSYQKTNYERQKNLFDRGLISHDAYDQAHLAYINAQQAVTQQQESVASQQQQVENQEQVIASQHASIEAQRQSIKMQEEYVKKAETNLGYATITSPISGTVLSKEVEEGQTVASSFNTPTLFKIAQDLTDMRVIADVDEADIGNVKEGQRVTFTVDAFPDDLFEGEVTQVRQEATTESNVVTYEVVISAPNADLKLKPGLTASVTIYTMEVKDVLKLPLKALKYTPNAEILNEGETIDDCKASQKVWVRRGTTIKALPVTTGFTNGIETEVKGALKAGDEVITDAIAAMEPQGEEPKNPFQPRPKERKNGNKPGMSGHGK